MVLVAAAGPVGAVAARRWKQQVNDDAKAPACDLALPGALAHELSGWGQHGDMTRQVFSLVELRHDHEHHDDVERFPAVEAMLDEVVHDRHVVRAEGEGPLAQLLRSEEHTSELQSLMRISYAVFCLKKKKEQT